MTRHREVKETENAMIKKLNLIIAEKDAEIVRLREDVRRLRGEKGAGE